MIQNNTESSTSRLLAQLADLARRVELLEGQQLDIRLKKIESLLLQIRTAIFTLLLVLIILVFGVKEGLKMIMGG